MRQILFLRIRLTFFLLFADSVRLDIIEKSISERRKKHGNIRNSKSPDRNAGKGHKLQEVSLTSDQLEEDIAEAEAKMAEPGFWDDSEAAQKVISENNANKETYDQFHSLAEELEEIELMVEMLQEEPDAAMQEEAETRINALDEKMKTYELSMLLRWSL